ncbi:MAG TPA: hypothetical protein VMY42_26995 [Thermoguttaceae bacterium]|nr:hypothetical protein [Thermoguttaceae bacterium]
MRSGHLLAAVLVCTGLGLFAADAPAQQVTVGTPFHSIGDSFYERFGTHWGLNWDNGFMTFGGPSMATPQFGKFDPSAGLNSGFAFRRNGVSGFFNWSAGQGFQQSFVTQTPSVTLTNGYPGFISDTSQSPFVISVIPVVGGYPMASTFPSSPYYPSYYDPYAMGNPMMAVPVPQVNPRVEAMRRQMAEAQQAVAGNAAERAAMAAGNPPPAVPGPAPKAENDLDRVGGNGASAAEVDGPAGKLAAAQASSAGQAVPSVAEARRLHQQEQAAQSEQAVALFIRARTAEESGKPAVAKIYYGMAAESATGELRDRIDARLGALDSSGSR